MRPTLLVLLFGAATSTAQQTPAPPLEGRWIMESQRVVLSDDDGKPSGEPWSGSMHDQYRIEITADSNIHFKINGATARRYGAVAYTRQNNLLVYPNGTQMLIKELTPHKLVLRLRVRTTLDGQPLGRQTNEFRYSR